MQLFYAIFPFIESGIDRNKLAKNVILHSETRVSINPSEVIMQFGLKTSAPCCHRPNQHTAYISYFINLCSFGGV